MKMVVISQMFPCKRHPTSAIFFANLIKELAPQMDELIVITPRVYIPRFLTKIKKKWNRWFIDPMTSKENRMEIIRPYVLSIPNIKFAGINGILMQYSLSNLVKNLIISKNIDILLGHNVLPEGIAAKRLAKKFKLPVVIWCLGTDVNEIAEHNYLNYSLTKKCLEKSQLIITTSKNLENKVRNYDSKLINAITFYRGIDLLNFRSLQSKHTLLKELNLDPESNYILFVGRLIKSKGIYELAEAFNNIADSYPNLKLILIGEEIEKENLLCTIKNHDIRKRLILQGVVSHSNVAKYMKASDLLVFPSWSEGLPNVVIEAMAAGLPVVASDAGGIPEILKNGETGLSVPVRNVKKLTEAIIKMIEDNNLRERCIRNAQELVSVNFDVKKNATKLYKLLIQVKSEYSVKIPSQ